MHGFISAPCLLVFRFREDAPGADEDGNMWKLTAGMHGIVPIAADVETVANIREHRCVKALLCTEVVCFPPRGRGVVRGLVVGKWPWDRVCVQPPMSVPAVRLPLFLLGALPTALLREPRGHSTM